MHACACSFAKFGCPHGCRAGIWEAALGLNQGRDPQQVRGDKISQGSDIERRGGIRDHRRVIPSAERSLVVRHYNLGRPRDMGAC